MSNNAEDHLKEGVSPRLEMADVDCSGTASIDKTVEMRDNHFRVGLLCLFRRHAGIVVGDHDGASIHLGGQLPSGGAGRSFNLVTALLVAGLGIVCSIGTVNIRIGNGTDCGRITAVADGTVFEHVGTAVNGWHVVKVSSQVGWVPGKYSEIVTV